MEKTKVLMVCLGNICRSPLAQGILESKVKELNIQVDSAGTAAYHIGNSPDPRSISVAKKYGIDISHQKARQFTKNDKTFQKYKWPSIDVTRKSVEETAASIIKIHEIYLNNVK